MVVAARGPERRACGCGPGDDRGAGRASGHSQAAAARTLQWRPDYSMSKSDCCEIRRYELCAAWRACWRDVNSVIAFA